jgi:hypothetical protein
LYAQRSVRTEERHVKSGVPQRLEAVRARARCATLREFWRELTKGAYKVSYEAVRNYHNDRDPPVEYLVHVAQAFGVSLEWLATGNGTPWPSDPGVREAAQNAAEDGHRREFEAALREVFWHYPKLPPLAVAVVLKTCDRLYHDAQARARRAGKAGPSRPYVGRFVGKALAGPLMNAVAGTVRTSDLHPWQLESYVLGLCQALVALIPNPNWIETQLKGSLH